jgi:hypothetical protein
MARRVFFIQSRRTTKNLHLNPFPEEEGAKDARGGNTAQMVRELPATKARKSGGAEYLLSLRQRIKLKVFGLRR